MELLPVDAGPEGTGGGKLYPSDSFAYTHPGRGVPLLPSHSTASRMSILRASEARPARSFGEARFLAR